MRWNLVANACVVAVGLAACGGDRAPPGADAAGVDAQIEPIPDDAIWLDPVAGKPTGTGAVDDPWPGLAASIDAGLLGALPVGATLVLRGGAHGDVSLAGDNPEMITIRAAPGEVPQLERLEIRAGQRWRLRGLTISPSFAAAPYTGNIVTLGERAASSELILEDSFVYSELDSSGWTIADWMAAPSGVLLGRNGRDLTLRNTQVTNTRFGVAITSFDSLVEGNVINNFSADGIRVTRDGATVAHNVIKNVYVSDADGDANHDDAIQCFLFNVGTGLVRDVTIRGNIIINREDDAQPFAAPVQAIGFFDGPLVNFLVEDNVILVSHWHGVSLYDAQGSQILDNVAFTRWPEAQPRPWVMLGEKLGMAHGNTVRGNYAHSFDFAADATVTAADNLPVTRAILDARMTALAAEIAARFGAAHPVSGQPRVVGW
ncbi:MAG: right-handed parallel beta-helix repeat-containing protein [Myxococcales bacterium]|nr:right-handed parallel beta-helix repeat-containing protein [Myxococcales bacterium]